MRCLCISQVILGGGRENFFPNTLPDTEYPDENGSRGDGRNLVQVYIPISHVYDVIASANGFIARQGRHAPLGVLQCFRKHKIAYII